MFGRLTNADAPACNAEGVPYRDLWLRTKSNLEQLIARQRKALELWEAAVDQDPNASERRKLLKEAKALTRFLLS